MYYFFQESVHWFAFHHYELSAHVSMVSKQQIKT